MMYRTQSEDNVPAQNQFENQALSYSEPTMEYSDITFGNPGEVMK